VLFAPGEAFGKVLKRPAFVAPLLLVVALNLGFTAVWLQKVDLEAFMKARLAESPRTANLSSEQRAEIVAQQTKVVPIFAWLGPLFVVLVAVIIAGTLVFVFRFFYASEVTFRQGLALTTWASAATSIVAVPLLLLTLYLKDDWTLNPQDVLQANPSLFVERGSISTFLFTLLTSLDLFSFWLIAMLAVGFGLAARRPFGSAVWGVAIPWALYVLGKAALSGMFG
jgi:Yip1 domain